MKAAVKDFMESTMIPPLKGLLQSVIKPIQPVINLIQSAIRPIVAAIGGAPTLQPGQRLPLSVRLRGWWEGYDLAELQARLDALGSEDSADSKEKKTDQEPGLALDGNRWDKAWNEERVKAAELIWGDGYCGPGGQEYVINLSKRLTLTPEMSMLNLGAGLGGPARTLAKNFGVWVDGMEGTAGLAETGMEMSVMAGLEKKASISHYDFEALPAFERTYDRVLANESMFTVRDKERLLSNVEGALKNGGLLMITDFVVTNEEALASAEVQDWIESEPVKPYPVTATAMEKMLKAGNFGVQVSENVSDSYKTMITDSWNQTQDLMPKLAQECDDEDGRKFLDVLLQEAELWSKRVKLIADEKLCAWRFLGGKKKIVLVGGW